MNKNIFEIDEDFWFLHPMKLKVKKLYEDSKLPIRAHSSDSGLDVFVHNFKKIYCSIHIKYLNGNKKYGEQIVDLNNEHKKELTLRRNERVLIGTGIAATYGINYEIQVRPKSGNAWKRGLTILNTPGTIDEQYRGEISVILINMSNEDQIIKIGDKIAQIVVCPVTLCDVEEVNSLDNTIRGDRGFGSTGN